MSFNSKTLDGAFDVEADNLIVNESTDLKGTSLIEGPSIFLQDLNLESTVTHDIIALSAVHATTSYRLALPPTIGTAGQVLSTNGSGDSSWQTVSSTTGGVTFIGIATVPPFLYVNGLSNDSTYTSKTFTLSMTTITTDYGGTGLNYVGTTGQVLTSNGSTLQWSDHTVTASSPIISSGGATPNISCVTTGTGSTLVLSDSPTLSGYPILSSYLGPAILAINVSNQIIQKATTGTNMVVLSDNPTLTSTIYADSINLTPLKTILTNGSITAVQCSLTGDLSVTGASSFTGAVSIGTAGLLGSIKMYTSVSITPPSADYPSISGYNLTTLLRFRLGYSATNAELQLRLLDPVTGTKYVQLSSGFNDGLPGLFNNPYLLLTIPASAYTLTTPYGIQGTIADLQSFNLLSVTGGGSLVLNTDTATPYLSITPVTFDLATTTNVIITTPIFKINDTQLAINGVLLTSTGLDSVTFTTAVSYNITTTIFKINDTQLAINGLLLTSTGLDSVSFTTAVSYNITTTIFKINTTQLAINGLLLTSTGLDSASFTTAISYNITTPIFNVNDIFKISADSVSFNITLLKLTPTSLSSLGTADISFTSNLTLRMYSDISTFSSTTESVLGSLELITLSSPSISLTAEAVVKITTAVLNIEGSVSMIGDTIIEGTLIADDINVANITSGNLDSGDIVCGNVFCGNMETADIDCADIVALEINCVNISSVFDESAIFLGAPV